MRIYDIDLSSYTAGEIDAADWLHVLGTNDLGVATRLGRIFIEAGSSIDDTRIEMFRRGSPFADHAVELLIDRTVPFRTSSMAQPDIGIVLMWQTSTRDVEYLLKHGEPNALRNFSKTSENAYLGLTNHVRVYVDDTSVRVDEIREGVTRNLASQVIPATARFIAIRAMHVQNEIVVWVNFDGIVAFEDAPIIRVHMLIEGVGRPGLILGPRGRILSVRVETSSETAGQSMSIYSASQESLNLTPIRATLTLDESRPPIETELQVAPFSDDQLVPERQQRMSRVFLSDARFHVRPGHQYRVSGCVRDVDDTEVRFLGVAPGKGVFSVAGTAQDLRPRDTIGALLLHPDDATPVGESRSGLTKLGWPSNLEVTRPLNVVIRSDEIPGIFLDQVARGITRSHRVPRVFDFSLTNLTDEALEEFREFLASVRGRVNRFIWKHPMTDEPILVRMNEPSLVAQYVEGGVRAAITLLELFPFERVAVADMGPYQLTSGGTSTSGSSTGTTTAGSSTSGATSASSITSGATSDSMPSGGTSGSVPPTSGATSASTEPPPTTGGTSGSGPSDPGTELTTSEGGGSFTNTAIITGPTIG